MSRPLVAMALLLMASTSAVPAAGDVAANSDPQALKDELLSLVSLQSVMLAKYEEQVRPMPHLQASIQQQLKLISELSDQQLQLVARHNMRLRELNAELAFLINDLDFAAISSVSVSQGPVSKGQGLTAVSPAPVTAGAPHLGDRCEGTDADDFNGEIGIGAVRFPPGPCNQIDNIPTEFNANDGTRVRDQFRLSDVQYPLACPFNTDTNFIIGNEIGLQIVRSVEFTATLLCDQEVAGFNSASVCTPISIAVEITDQLFAPLKYCNGVRRNSEGTAIYVRTAELFVQSDAHYTALNERSDETGTKIGNLESDVTVEVNLYGSEVSDELQAGFGGIDDRMDALELKIQENALRSDFVRRNNDEIIREIRIQKARILDDLLN